MEVFMKSVLVLVSTLISIAAFADAPPVTANPIPNCPIIRTGKVKYTLKKYSWVQDGPNWVEQPSTVCSNETDINVYQLTDGPCNTENLPPTGHCTVQLNGTSEDVYVYGLLSLVTKDETDQPHKTYNVGMHGSNEANIPFISENMETHDLGLKDASFVLQSFLPVISPGGPRPNDLVSATITIEDPSAK